MNKILIIDDDKSLLELLQNCMNGLYEVDTAWNGRQGLDKLSQTKYDLVLLDVMLLGENGFEVLGKIRKQYALPVIMLTAKNSPSDKVSGLGIGADDYVTKPFSIVLLGKRITALLRRIGKTEPANIWIYKDIIVDFSGFSAEKAGKLIDISPKEVQLLKILVDHTGVVLTRDQILDSIWGTDVPLNDRTIDTYIGRLRKKLGLDCIVTVKGIGYKFEAVR